MSDDAAPERWSADAGERDVARLEIPPHASRERGFEIYCSLAVKAQGSGEAWHELRVLVDGALAWSRRVSTQPSGRDSLDVRLRRQVPAGQPLRLTAVAQTQRAARLGLVITADEE
ncbi:hypothetical protein [Methylibium sp.]|uniref:hypothetical protein n=1 Tax=Methylibium sp. TaxID=2067992 RepID=UPI003BAD7CD3